MDKVKPFLGDRYVYVAGKVHPAMSRKALEALHRIREKIENGVYSYEDSKCVCGGARDLLLSERDRYGNYYPFVICRNCGVMRANPRLSAKAFVEFYSQEYRTLYGDNDSNKEHLYSLRIEQAENVHDFISGKIELPAGGVVYDIGCNMGTMLLPFSRQGCDVMGVDYDAQYIEFGRSKTGLNLEVGGVEKLASLKKKADLIILSHVLEHFLDIGQELKKIAALMRPRAHLYVSLPGTYWWIRHNEGWNILGVLQNAHVWQFSLATLNYVMKMYGFELLYGNEKIEAIYVYSGKEVANKEPPEREYSKAMSYLTNTERFFRLKRCILDLLRYAKRKLRGGP